MSQTTSAIPGAMPRAGDQPAARVKEKARRAKKVIHCVPELVHTFLHAAPPGRSHTAALRK